MSTIVKFSPSVVWNRVSKSASKCCLDSLQYWACVHAEITGTAATVPIQGSGEACVCAVRFLCRPDPSSHCSIHMQMLSF